MINGREHAFDCFTFPGGEEHVRIPHATLHNPVHITAKITNSSELMRLLLLKDAVDRLDPLYVLLKLPYVPYARQDRVCNPGEAHSLLVLSDLINRMRFNRVTVLDPHSFVTEALISNLEVVRTSDIVLRHNVLHRLLTETVIICPDQGAAKKTLELAKIVKKPFIQADKFRDLKTGKILATRVHCEEKEIAGQDVTIWDDICDGGRTFIELAKVLKEKGAKHVYLYVTHGIFSKGYEPLLESGIDHIYTTDSLNPPPHKQRTLIKECY
jgi:ribose-phosphate pyrophosphokinase